MKIICLLSLFCILTGCASDPYKIVLADEVMAEYIGMTVKQENLWVKGTGGAMMMGIEKLNFYFGTSRTVNLDEARATLVRCVNRFFNLMNDNKKIRPYLVEYPFPLSGLDLGVTFSRAADPCYHDAKSCVSRIYFSKGVAYYRTFSAEKDEYPLFLEETYEEALERVVPPQP